MPRCHWLPSAALVQKQPRCARTFPPALLPVFLRLLPLALFACEYPQAEIPAGRPVEKAEGRRICVEVMQGIRELPGAAGVHVMAPMQSTKAIAQVIEDSGILRRDGTARSTP